MTAGYFVHQKVACAVAARSEFDMTRLERSYSPPTDETTCLSEIFTINHFFATIIAVNQSSLSDNFRVHETTVACYWVRKTRAILHSVTVLSWHSLICYFQFPISSANRNHFFAINGKGACLDKKVQTMQCVTKTSN